VEVPSDLYDRLRGEADRRDVPVASLATWLLMQALDVEGPHPTVHEQLDEIARMVREIHERIAQQGQAVQGVQGQVNEMREYMELRIPPDVPILRSHSNLSMDQAHESRNRLIDEMKRERGG
jgi:hypothetical protein